MYFKCKYKYKNTLSLNCPFKRRLGTPLNPNKGETSKNHPNPLATVRNRASVVRRARAGRDQARLARGMASSDPSSWDARLGSVPTARDRRCPCPLHKTILRTVVGPGGTWTRGTDEDGESDGIRAISQPARGHDFYLL